MADKKMHTKFGQHAGKLANGQRVWGAIETGVGVAATGMGILGTVTNTSPIVGPLGVANGISVTANGLNNMKEGHQRKAKVRALDDVMHRATKGKSSGPQSWNNQGTERNARSPEFAQANQHFEASHQMGPNAGGAVPTGTQPGWSEKARMASAQSRGATYNGDGGGDGTDNFGS